MIHTMSMYTCTMHVCLNHNVKCFTHAQLNRLQTQHITHLSFFFCSLKCRRRSRMCRSSSAGDRAFGLAKVTVPRLRAVLRGETSASLSAPFTNRIPCNLSPSRSRAEPPPLFLGLRGVRGVRGVVTGTNTLLRDDTGSGFL